MSFLPVYLDSSAILKLVWPEAETNALRAALERWPDRVSSVLARVEVNRALHRTAAPLAIRARGDAVLAAMVLINIDDGVLARASSFTDPLLRSIDAMHLAAALSIGDDPEAFVTYDDRLARAAVRQRLTVLHPGVTRLKS